MREKAGIIGLAAGCRGHGAALQCALCQATRWPAGFLSVPLRLAAPANHPRRWKPQEPQHFIKFASRPSCYMPGEENHCAKQSDNSSDPEFQAVRFDALR